MILFYAVVSLSAFLLFLVQPIIAKQILAWFGGSAAVWTTSLVFFQCALLAGYAYADIVTRKLAPPRLSKLHIGFALLCLVALPIIPSVGWKPTGEEAPISRILLLLTVVIGLPYVLLSTTSPLVQSWFARAFPGRDPYRLFAVSNAASLIALVGYPFLLEPNAGTRAQAWIWSGLFVLFVALLCALAWKMRANTSTTAPVPAAQISPVSSKNSQTAPQVFAESEAQSPTFAQTLRWLGLSATGSILLLSVTNHLSHNIPSVPLMWIVPLTIYLITFILTFDGRGWYNRVAFVGPAVISIAAMGWLLIDKDYQFDLQVQTIVYAIGLFVCCMLCHGELVSAKPGAAGLTRFYLCVSIGGAIGSVLVGIVAPLMLPGFYDMALALVCVAFVIASLAANAQHSVWKVAAACVIGGALAIPYLQISRDRDGVLAGSRNFYGTLKVKTYGRIGTEDHFNRLVHGAILHGEQYTHEKWRREPSTYYTRTSGVGRITEAKQKSAPQVRLGMVGLGVGTYAAYGRPGDFVKFYEIDPHVIALARAHFWYLTQGAAEVDVALGDARLTLEREAAQNFDVLAIDAFSSDSIPAHLITVEAVEVYLKHLKPDGVLAFHVSNRFLDLPPVLDAIANHHKLAAMMVEDPAQKDNGLHSSSTWVLLSRSNAAFVPLAGELTALPPQPSWRLWTDDYSNLTQVLKSRKDD
jgi:SAM-dependent methyltransferase/MFS family permease